MVGIAVGSCAGLVGGGAGLLIVPALVFLFGFTQHQAQGTALAAFLPPVTFLAVLPYYYRGDVNTKVALLLIPGLLLGGFFGAKLATGLSGLILQRIFGCILLLTALKMIFFTK